MKSEKLTISQALSNKHFANFCGALDDNLRAIEKKLELKIIRQNYVMTLTGQAHNIKRAKDSITKLINLSENYLDKETINSVIMETKMQEQIKVKKTTKVIKKNKPVKKQVVNKTAKEKTSFEKNFVLPVGRKNISARTLNQLKYLQAINREDLVFGIGPAGTGKTYLAVASAVNALEQSSVQRIVLTRPALEAGERLGFLPGTLAEKVDPYLRPVYDALYDTLGVEKFHRYMSEGVIEIAPLAFMRGRTLNESFIILDEAQNTTNEQMKMFLTRIGFGSKAVVNGDLTQTDLPHGKPSGLAQAVDKLNNIDEINFSYFDHNDIVRHPLVAKIVKAYG